jgi:glycine amidinotransferase/scyllo-inosamine-4-phosphate amidinotransferase 1
MKINRYDDFTKLREVVLGQVNYSPLDMIKDENDRNFMKQVLDKTKSSLSSLEQIFKQFDVKVWRPEVFEHKNEIRLGSPYIELNSVYTSLTPFDNFLTIADTVVEMSSANFPSAMFDFVQYQHIWKEKFNHGSRWISMPRSSYNPNKADAFDGLSNFEPYGDSPSLLIAGDTVFAAENYMFNQLGMDWLKREFPQFKFNIFKDTNGHLDSYLAIIKPGLVLSGLQKDKLPEQFNGWEVVEFGKENYKDVNMISDYFQDNDYDNTTLAVNVISIDPENIVMYKHVVDNNIEQIRKIEKQGINVIPLELDVSRWLNVGLHCFCNPLVRDGELTNYF